MEYNVKNRSAGMVVYSIPEEGIRRQFMAREIKRISDTELEKLCFQPGGREILTDFLQVLDDKAIKDLNLPIEPEYYMNEKQIADLIKTGSLDAFLDCLDFAPTGVIDIIKHLSISIPMTDTEKIAALKEKTGYDVSKALAIKKADEEEDGKASPKEKQERRVVEEQKVPEGRRTTPQYKVVSK